MAVPSDPCTLALSGRLSNAGVVCPSGRVSVPLSSAVRVTPISVRRGPVRGEGGRGQAHARQQRGRGDQRRGGFFETMWILHLDFFL